MNKLKPSQYSLYGVTLREMVSWYAKQAVLSNFECE